MTPEKEPFDSEKAENAEKEKNGAPVPGASATDPEPASAGDSPAPQPAGIPTIAERSATPLFRKTATAGAVALVIAIAAGVALTLKALPKDPAVERAVKTDATLFTSRATLKLPAVPPAPAESRPAAASSSPAAAAPASSASGVPPIEVMRQAPGPAQPAPPAKAPAPDQKFASPLFSGNAGSGGKAAVALDRAGADKQNETAASPHAGADPRLSAYAAAPAIASALADKTFTLLKGSVLQCVLESRLDTTVPGLTRCVLPRDVWSADGKTLLLEKGSRAVGEYRSGVSMGAARIFILWTEIVTPHGVRIRLSSPAADPLGGAGVSGTVDYHWWQRFGNALIFSLIDDGFNFGITKAQDASGGTNFYSNSSQTTQKIVEEAMRTAGDIPPTLTRNQGSRISIVTARDLDFRPVYGFSLKD
jgi:type IV secretion system protein VirB10